MKWTDTDLSTIQSRGMENSAHSMLGLGALVAEMAEQGINAAALLQGTGLAPEQLADPKSLMSTDQKITVFRNVKRLSSAPDVGLRAGCRQRLSDFGVYGYALISSATFGDAVLSGVRHVKLAERLRKEFSKVIPHFDALALLQVVGQSQIGRLRFARPGEAAPEVPTENLTDLLAHDGAEGLFDSLLARYAVHSGISGAMPKVLVRDSAALSRLSHRGATHIVKAWTDDYPRLAENEYFCMRAALHAGLAVPTCALSSGGQFLLVERFDLRDGVYLGFEDFCVLNGKTASQKYDGSYEGVTRRIRDFVSPEQVRPALAQFFKALALSCALKNGDAHLKNFGVLYDDAESEVRLAPIYDLVTTTAYKPADILALTLGGSKRWPAAKALLAFARTHCNMTEARARELLGAVAQGVLRAAQELRQHLHGTPAFQTVGAAMLAEWSVGLKHSNQP